MTRTVLATKIGRTRTETPSVWVYSAEGHSAGRGRKFLWTGYYYFVIDKAPKPGEYPHMAQAMIGVGDLLPLVTVLCRSKDSEGLRQTIQVLQSASQN